MTKKLLFDDITVACLVYFLIQKIVSVLFIPPISMFLAIRLKEVDKSSTWITTNTGYPRRNVRDFGRVFLMLNYTDITQNTYVQSWTVTEIMAIEKCGPLGCPRTVSRHWRHIPALRMPGNETPLANIVMQWPWRDNGPAAACVKYLET